MTPALITEWLQQPHQRIDSEQLSEQLDRYPYFVPYHYIQLANAQHSDGPVVLNGYPDLYICNRLLFVQLMQRSTIPLSVTQVANEAERYDAPAERTPEATEPQQMLVDHTPADRAEELNEEALIQPISSEDYFLHQGISVTDSIPEEPNAAHGAPEAEVAAQEVEEDPRSLMVVMSFTEWLMHFKSKTQKEKEEEEDRKAVKHMWQKEKLAAALEEEDDEIPENVFEMAVNSISKEDGLVSESLAEILAKQGKWEKAIEMYRKLSLRNPQKSAYFAQQIAVIQKKAE